ncbi:MAG: hypothetical protein ACON35_05070 [Candidatus Marinamargulisbacteria bacterium]
MSLKQQQNIDLAHLFSDHLMLFLNNAFRSPLPETHKRIIQNYMEIWQQVYINGVFVRKELQYQFFQMNL